ncbi:VOC family protein [Pseudohalocynthiibacter aestuariivivens]|uniref:VOC family protein n=1 Tax=Roseovarius pelagicus TaxID=2980108 RepID=A0ABY6DB24_9RHOB|nr:MULTISPECIES: VOC family protein [Rhodobacterales]QIE44737.1 VOC family protein [Pseudohalocynthiibacter aestuariivivens]UXX83351.1 VOC family protein [Roseovarius pelagicus]
MKPPQVSALDHLVLTVRDIHAAAAFYTQILGMRHEAFTGADGSTRTALYFGAQKINLHSAAAPFSPHAATPLPGSADLCFLTETPLDAWQAHLSTHGIQIEAGPVPRSGATVPIISLYIRDPDENLIEIALPA